MKKYRHFILVVVLMLMALPVWSQSRDINLTISITAPDGSAVSDASATLKQVEYQLTYGNIVFSDGKATVKVYPGDHELTVAKPGYEMVTSTFLVMADTTVNVHLKEWTQRPFSLTTQVLHNAVTGLNDVVFTWNKETPVFFDDFESYDAFSIQFGEWTGIDGDQLATATLQGSYLNCGVLQYAQVINPMKVVPAWWYDYPVLRPYEGQQYVGFTRTMTGAPNDDWLISPAITVGNMNVLQFMAKAADVYKEKFQVYVTEKLDNPGVGDFTMISSGNYETVDYKTWYRKVYDLSSYSGKTVKFAIRYMSEANSGGAFMLMIDNVFVGQSFNAPDVNSEETKSRRVVAMSPMNPNESFKVYLNDVSVDSTQDYEYVFKNLEDGTYKLGVQAVYQFSQSDLVDTVITIAHHTVKLTVSVETNNGCSLDGEKVILTHAGSGYMQEAEVVAGKALFPSLPKGEYYLGMKVAHFNTHEGKFTIGCDSVIHVVLHETIVTPYNITADAVHDGPNSNQVTVRWNQNLSFVDSFEDYPDFATGKFGEWTTYDLDQRNTYPVGLGSQDNIVTFPGASTPQNPCPVPPMVFNPWKTVPPMLPADPAVQAPQGDKTVIFFSPQQAGANKWLVSPEILARDGFVCRFTAKAYAQYPESMEVCVFSAGKCKPVTDAYEQMSVIDDLSYGTWAIYETDLSKYAGQKIRIGIHYISYDAFFAQIDNFYVGNGQDEGSTVDVGQVDHYVVYLDGNSVSTTQNNSYCLNRVPDGTHKVGVQAIYTSGASEVATHAFTTPLSGDVNGDGIVNVSDVNELINMILSTSHKELSIVDVNGDGIVNVSDVTALINLISEK